MKTHTAENIFYQNYRKEVKAVEKTFESSLSFQHIHHLRVHIKNIKTFFLLFDEAAPGQLKIKKCRSVFQKVFKTAGKVRDLQLNHSLAKQSDVAKGENAAYTKYIRKKIRRAKKDLDKTRSSFDTALTRKADGKVKKLCKTLSSNYILLQSKQFIAKEIKQVQAIPEKNGNEGFHQLRKHMKSIYAIAFLLCKTHPGTLLKKELGQLKKSEQAIGKWHDELLFHISWAHFKKHKNQAQDKKMTLSQHLKKSKVGDKKSIHALLQHILDHLPQEVIQTHN